MPTIEDLKLLLEEIETLKRQNLWTQEKFDRLLKLAREIVGPKAFMLEAVVNHAGGSVNRCRDGLQSDQCAFQGVTSQTEQILR